MENYFVQDNNNSFLSWLRKIGKKNLLSCFWVVYSGVLLLLLLLLASLWNICLVWIWGLGSGFILLLYAIGNPRIFTYVIGVNLRSYLQLIVIFLNLFFSLLYCKLCIDIKVLPSFFPLDPGWKQFDCYFQVCPMIVIKF